MATFGQPPTDVGNQGLFGLDGFTQVSGPYTLSENGSLTKMSVSIDSTFTTDPSASAVVYVDSAGAPGARVGRTSTRSITHPGDTGWQDFTFASPLELAAGSYWLGVNSSGTGGWAARSWSQANKTTFKAGLPDPFGTPGGQTEGELLVYATYDPIPPVYFFDYSLLPKKVMVGKP